MSTDKVTQRQTNKRARTHTRARTQTLTQIINDTQTETHSRDTETHRDKQKKTSVKNKSPEIDRRRRLSGQNIRFDAAVENRDRGRCSKIRRHRGIPHQEQLD